MNYEKVRKYKDMLLLFIGVIFISYLTLKHLLIYLLPFLVGWFLAFAMRTPALFIGKKLRIKPKIVRLFLTIALFLVFFGLSALAVWFLSREVWALVVGIGQGESSLEEFISGITSSEGFIGKLLGNFGTYVADAIYGIVTSMLTSLGSALSGLMSAVPKTLFFVLVTVIASAYFAVGLEDVNAAVKRILPKGIADYLVKLKNGFFSAFFRYMRSYLLLLVITFVEMLVGLLLLKAPYPLLMATLIALLDLLPVIGVGIVLIPWGVWSLVIRETSFGIGLFVLFGFHTVLRQIIEPKIIGDSVGMHPLLTLIFIYLGYSLFGIMGLILVPVLTVLVDITFGKKNSAEITESKS